ncbi:MAG: hypothetical protein H7257_08325 [Taibaiella sp.]|nr:hypothetical protein [Taibaiella sp.]
MIEVNKQNYKRFSFILRCITLSQRPFFHYDSAGASHRNYDDSLPLKEQKVDTPHFNCFKESGLSWAYKTEKLKNESERIALEDIYLCNRSLL